MKDEILELKAALRMAQRALRDLGQKNSLVVVVADEEIKMFKLIDVRDPGDYMPMAYVCDVANVLMRLGYSGFCERPEGCVCGGDTRQVREGCSNWVNQA